MLFSRVLLREHPLSSDVESPFSRPAKYVGRLPGLEMDGAGREQGGKDVLGVRLRAELAFFASANVVHHRLDLGHKVREIPNFRGSSLGRFPLDLAHFWTSDRLSGSSRKMDPFSGPNASGTFVVK